LSIVNREKVKIADLLSKIGDLASLAEMNLRSNAKEDFEI